MEGDRGREPGSNGDGKSTGGGERKGRRWDTHAAGAGRNRKSISQQKRHTEISGTNKEGGENRRGTRYGKREMQAPLPSPHTPS